MYPDTRGRTSTDCTGSVRPVNSFHSIISLCSTAETVTDAAGNVSSPSNVVTVKIVNAPRLCTLTVDDVKSSSAYQELKPARRTEADVLTGLACSALASNEPPMSRVSVARYEQFVDVLEQQGWLTAAQARLLASLSEGL